MKTQIRRAGLNDFEAIAPLFDSYRRFYQQTSDLPLARAFISERLKRNESVIFLAEDGQHVPLGFTQLYPSFSSVSARPIWILNDLFVAPDARGQQVGRQLLNAARDHALATGAKRLVLSTAIDNPAQRLYESLGYVKDTEFLHYELGLD